MRADYDSEGGTIQIELEGPPLAGHGEDVEDGAVVVMVHEGRPVSLDVMNAREPGFERSLRLVAERYALDADALVAASRAALAAPDRTVSVEVGAPAAA